MDTSTRATDNSLSEDSCQFCKSTEKLGQVRFVTHEGNVIERQVCQRCLVGFFQALDILLGVRNGQLSVTRLAELLPADSQKQAANDLLMYLHFKSGEGTLVNDGKEIRKEKWNRQQKNEQITRR